MSFVKVTHHNPADSELRHPLTRPKFHQQNTADRLREGRPPSFTTTSNIRKGRRSIFKEVGLDDEHDIYHKEQPNSPTSRQAKYEPGGESLRSENAAAESKSDVEPRSANRHEREPQRSVTTEIQRLNTSSTMQNSSTSAESSPTSPNEGKSWYSKFAGGRRPRIKAASSAPPQTMASMTRLAMLAMLIAVILPAFSYYNGRQEVSMSGADAGAIPPKLREGPVLDIRQTSPTQVCTRWSQQSALLNGTLYLYGGQAKTTGTQTTDTWNNDFLTLDLTKSWDVGSPALKGLVQPSGPPAVANGYLWNDYNNLYLYGGEFADNPFAEPAPMATWQYGISSQKWTSYDSPQTVAGNNSDGGRAPVQRAAEGAGLSVPELGMSWYFGGHLDLSTTPGWSNQVARVYLKSLLEFTHPGFANDGVTSLKNAGAGDGGAYRNITQGGLQTDSGFSERADGVLVFIPGWGDKGILIGLGGGTNDTLTNDFSTLDVYDIANSVWYHQKTSGTPPSPRVNACGVVASAPDASSFQIYLYGGQNLVPYDSQIQYGDMYILSIPSFTWINVTQTGDHQPSPRAGHTCNLRDGQMVVVGGYVGKDIPCDSPGIYVFNASSLAWESSFTALAHANDLEADNSVKAASFGYQVPDAVARVVGGGAAGSATATTPAAGPATGGPFATGRSPVFTVTDSAATATVTQAAPGVTAGVSSGSGAGGGSDSSSSATPAASSSGGSKGGLIAAGIIAGLAGLAAAYLGYCAWLYRRQVRAYKRHLLIANRYNSGADGAPGTMQSNNLLNPFAALMGRKSVKTGGQDGAGVMSEKRGRGHRRDESSSTADSYGWVGQKPVDPKLLFDDPSPGSYSGASGSKPSPGYTGPYGAQHYGHPSGSGSATVGGVRRSGSQSGGSTSSTENLLAGQEPSFFSVVVGPRRALRVVNGMEGEEGS